MNNNGNEWQGVTVAMLVRKFSCSGGLELYTHKLTEELLAKGLLITVICEETESSYSHKNLRVIQIAHSKAGSTKTEQVQHYMQKFSQAVNEYGPFDIVHSQHLGARNIDVVTFHNHTIRRANQVCLPIESFINKLKLLFRSDYKLRNQIDAQLVREASVLIFPSEICKDDFIKNFNLKKHRDEASMMVAYPGWQLGSETNHDIAGNNGNTINKEQTIIFVGRGYRKKGLDILLSACQLLKNEISNFKLLIAGLEEKFIDRWRLKIMGLDKNVSYLGFCKNMKNVYEQGSIIVLPSKIEPFGMSVIQAMNFGLVPLVSRVSGVSELLSIDQDAIIIENHLNKKEIMQKLASLLKDADKLNKLSKAAQIKAQQLSWTQTLESTLGAYKQVFQRKYIYEQ